jgi:ribulose-5-phosphate 4-epimerase/fuculose-1-phosphate aldolase
LAHGVDIRSLSKELVAANHILYDRGILDAFGHVSQRHPYLPHRFLLSRNLAPALVAERDIREFNLDGSLVDGKSENVYLERFIHGEIYRIRPDVTAVVHSHSQQVLPFTMVPGVSLCPVCHMSGFLRPKTPVFEVRNHAGDGCDLLIRSQALGRHLAECLADHPVVLMRGHGMTVVGATLRQAVFRAVYTEANARIQAAAMNMGGPTTLTAAEAQAADGANNGQIDRAWSFWELHARRTVAALHEVADMKTSPITNC